MTSTVPYLVSLGVLVPMVAGCGSSDSPTGLRKGTGTVTEPIAAVTLLPGNDTLWVDEARIFRVYPVDSQGNPVSGATFTWTSSNISVAIVDASGAAASVRVTGVAEGEATITATAEGKSGTATVAVRSLQLASVDAGALVTCGLTPDGAAYCWGRNFGDEHLGVGPISETCLDPFSGDRVSCSTVPRAVLGGLTFASLSVGNAYSCGLEAGGAAYCWGFNEDGRLGTGDRLASAVPVAVAGGLTFASISAGQSHVCGLTASGVAYCWGSNQYGQLGDGTPGNSDMPAAVAGGLTFTALDVSESGAHTCGVTPTGAAYCWGINHRGQLGNGAITDLDLNPAPIAVSGGLNFESVNAGLGHTCGVTVSGDIYCWGKNDFGQLGDGTFTDSATPRPVSGGLVFGSVTAGDDHTCGVATDGTAYCWGGNYDGQLGTGTDPDQNVPTAVAGGLTFASVNVGWWHSCGITTDSVAYCWGWNPFGELGDGQTEEGPTNAPVRVVGQP